MVLERTQTESAVEELEAELASSLATRARLDAEVTGQDKIRFPRSVGNYPRFLANQRDLFAQRRRTLSDEVDSVSASIGSVNQELTLKTIGRDGRC